MEVRTVVALLLIAAMTLCFGGFLWRAYAKKRQFKRRQSGRDKGHTPLVVEPAE